MSTLLKLIALPLLLAALAGCATNPVTGNPNFVLMSEEQEIALGAKTHKDVMKQYQVYNNPEIQALVDRVGRDLAAQSHRSHLDFTFTVLDSPEVNAFATPGGYIYITRGIMAYMNNEEQLAGVLGHEIGHVTARHSVRQHSAQTTAGLLSMVAAVATRSNNVGQVTSQFGQAFVSGYGRNHELEADRLGAEYLAGIGFDPGMMLGVVGILKDQEEFEKQRAREEGRQPRVYHGVFASHPRNDQRLQEVVRAAEKFRNPNARHSDPNQFLRKMEGVSFGSSEDQGVLRGNNFYHKPLDLHIAFPETWKVDNQPNQLVALAPGEDTVIIMELVKRGEESSPEQYLKSQVKNLRNGESLDNSSYAGIFYAKTQTGEVPVRVAATFHGDNVLIVKGFAKEGLPGDEFYQSVRSIRGLNPRERKLASGQRIKLRRVKKGDTFAKLAAKSTINGYAEAQLRLLNGMYPDGEPVPGQLIKIIK